MARLDLLRHGEPVGGPRYRGDGVDDPLTPEGLVAMWRAVEGGVWDIVISSPLQRCRTFAEAYAEKSGLPLVIEPRLREINLGVWEGLSHEEVQTHWAEAYAAYKRDIVTGMPYGSESVLAFMERVREALDELAARHAGQRVLVVCHAVVMRASLALALDAPPQVLNRIRVDYAAMLRLRHVVETLPSHPPVDSAERSNETPGMVVRSRWAFEGLINPSPL
ncbi:histidine phosphatase family protein [Thiofaba sp. EF100]|uniref:histidine phosphatase family protein n=1 Tax=Thiofaba sp. EF100 TaxID=3121274 RepID=UPI0032213D26